jgi:hypothetical protein
MTPRQVIVMVCCWAIVPAIIAAAIALPAGTVLEPVVARAIVSAQAGPAENMALLMPGRPGGAGRIPGAPGGAVRLTRPPPHQQPRIGQQSGRPARASHGFFAPLSRTAGRSPYTPGELALLALAGLAIALAGALGPAIWAAAAKTTTALRAE